MKLDLSSDCNSYRIVTGGLGFWKLNNERVQNKLVFALRNVSVVLSLVIANIDGCNVIKM